VSDEEELERLDMIEVALLKICGFRPIDVLGGYVDYYMVSFSLIFGLLVSFMVARRFTVDWRHD